MFRTIFALQLKFACSFSLSKLRVLCFRCALTSFKPVMGLMGIFLVFSMGYAAPSTTTYFETQPVGWHWNNAPQKPEEQKGKTVKKEDESSSLDPIQQVLAIRHQLNEAKAKAVLDPTTQNIARYLALQTWISNQSSLFASQWQKTLLYYPQYSYAIAHPEDASIRQVYEENNRQSQKVAARALAHRWGLLFFYRGANPLAQQYAPTVQGFANRYGFALIGVSMDGRALPSISHNQINQGQAQSLHIQYLPALVLVNPKTHKAIPLAYGYLSSNQLLKAVNTANQDFKKANPENPS